MQSSLKKAVMAHINSPEYQPQSKSELARSLDISTNDRNLLRQVLSELVTSGEITEGNHHRYHKRTAQKRLLRGRVSLKANGDGFFTPDFREAENAEMARSLGLEEGVRIPVDAADLATGLHGDVVLAKVDLKEPPPWWKHVPEKRQLMKQVEAGNGKITEVRIQQILERRNTNVTGTFHLKNKFAWVIPDDKRLPHTIEILTDGETRAKSGDKVVVEITQWHTRNNHPRGVLSKRLGRPGEPGVDMLGIISTYNLPLEFPNEVTREAEEIPLTIPPEDLKDREDWRGREVITIDPFDARDFDDAIAVTRHDDGSWEVAVHIADVSHYVFPGTALDREARKRGNSVYLADRVIPMLPERLSNGACSLRPDEDHLTRVAVMQFDKSGKRTGARFAKAVICSRQRYTYEQAYQELKPFLDHPEKAWDNPATPLPARAWTLASLLRKRRFQNGSLDLDFPEVKVVLDKDGAPLRLTKIINDESHQLIEEFMLAANEAVAEHIRRANTPGIYRVHEEPDFEKLEELRRILHEHGIRAADLSVRQELQRALVEINARVDSPMLKLSVLKSMKRAAYHPDCTGHYGLAMDNYTHFTSPIRRYSDLLVHRIQANLLFGERAKLPSYDEMKEISEHLSDTERNAAEAELESRKLKELAYFQKLITEGQPTAFDAVVTDLRRVGLFVELSEVMTKGIVRKEGLPDRGAYFDATRNRFHCPKSGHTFKQGDVIRVIPVEVEKGRGTVAFQFVSGGSNEKAVPSREATRARITNHRAERGKPMKPARRKRK